MKLYKYYPDNVNSLKSISVRGLWCHYPNKMNDPADCLSYLDREITKKEIDIFRMAFKDSADEKIRKIYNYSDKLISDFLNIQRKKFIELYTFCSLSETFDDILMWSHYSSSHTGFVIEFEFEEEEIDYHFRKVNYTDFLPKLDVLKIAEFMNGKEENIYCFLEDASLKSMVWSSEKEWRIWRDKPSYYHYKGKNIKNVYFGVNASIETKAIVVKLVRELNKDVLFHFMEFSKNPVRLTYRS
jgi:hypothetical protein|tara:strand:- start:3410 stop:4135 length:726 start_codon:yes stop_codon:yes gene_type:complete